MKCSFRSDKRYYWWRINFSDFVLRTAVVLSENIFISFCILNVFVCVFLCQRFRLRSEQFRLHFRPRCKITNKSRNYATRKNRHFIFRWNFILLVSSITSLVSKQKLATIVSCASIDQFSLIKISKIVITL